jgi:hypothetical protein
MNPKQQKEHRTVTQSLDERIAALETVVAAVLPAFKRSDGTLEERIAAAELCCQERWDAQGATNRRDINRQAILQNRTFWQRLSWLVLGK